MRRPRVIFILILAALVFLLLAFWHWTTEAPKAPEPPSRSRLVQSMEKGWLSGA